ncbi:MAG: hypothetical protein D3925_12795 [Candidatus Electrothrix sp. AR5]|nr:hypothetical protein [Candidatus Electrothrix sp. AR5]
MKSKTLSCLNIILMMQAILFSILHDVQAQKICTELGGSQGMGGDSRGLSLTERFKCKWDKNNITVKFLDGEQAVRKKVKRYAVEWQKYANIKFNFITSGNADIRISFKRRGSWSCVGKCPCEVNENEPTMNFGWLEADSSDNEYSRVVLHEFGHALGFVHEHQNPRSGIPWDEPAVYKHYAEKYSWNKEKTDRNIFAKYNKNETNFSDYDQNSIMHYAIPNEFTDGNFSVPWNTNFSAIDKKYASVFYSCRDNRARNYGKEEKCKYGYFFGHKNRAPGVKYVWPSPWNSNGYVWCHIPNHQMLLYGLKISEGSIQYIGHEEGINRYHAKYWSRDCGNSVFRQFNQ